MTRAEFIEALYSYCALTSASQTSGIRTLDHNREVKGVAGSAHLFGLAADLIYDRSLPLPLRQDRAKRCGLLLIAEDDHDHVQPLNWPAG